MKRAYYRQFKAKANYSDQQIFEKEEEVGMVSSQRFNYALAFFEFEDI